MAASQEFILINRHGVDNEVTLTSDTGKFGDADLREAIKPSWDPIQQSTIAIYKWDTTNECKVGEPIVDCDDLVTTYGAMFAYEVSRRQTLYTEGSTFDALFSASLYRNTEQTLAWLYYRIAQPPWFLPDTPLKDVLRSDVGCPPTSGTESDMQVWLGNVAEQLKEGSLFELVADNNSKGGWLYQRKLPGGKSAAVVAIEVKAPGEPIHGVVTSIRKYMHAIMQQQPHRTFCFGLVTNGADFRLFKVVAKRHHSPRKRHDFTYTLLCTSVKFSTGQTFLAWLLSATLSDLGYLPLEVSLDGTKHQLLDYLGSGQFCNGYALQLSEGTTMVVKHYREKQTADLERATYEVMKGLPHVSQLYDVQPDDPLFVAITPRGLPFDDDHPINADHVSCLCAALDSLHKKGLVHRDVCGSNIYWQSAKTAILTDWSHVATMSGDDDDDNAWQMKKDYLKLLRAVTAVGGSVELISFLVTSSSFFAPSPSKRGREDTTEPKS